VWRIVEAEALGHIRQFALRVAHRGAELRSLVEKHGIIATPFHYLLAHCLTSIAAGRAILV